MRVRDTLAEILKLGINDLVRSHGFTKSGFNYHRRRGEVVQVLNFQLSAGNFGAVGEFYINVGLAFDRLRSLDGKLVSEKLPAWQCCFNGRLNDLIAGAPESWKVSAPTDPAQVAAELTPMLGLLLLQLGKVDSIPAFLALNWLGAGADYGLHARLHYALGNLAIARDFLQREADYFADRHGCSVAELARRYHLDVLAQELPT